MSEEAKINVGEKQTKKKNWIIKLVWVKITSEELDKADVKWASLVPVGPVYGVHASAGQSSEL